MRVLLSEGSGLTQRQVATRLAQLGHRVEVLAPDPWCLARFTRHVGRLHAAPRYGADPFGWLERALAVFRAGRFDVLLPTQEQVAVLARCGDRLQSQGVATAIPPFQALAQVQDKVSSCHTLSALGIPQPAARVVTRLEDLLAWDRFPVYVKRPIGTATLGVRKVASRDALREAAAACADAFPRDGLLLQEPVQGPLAMVQGVFCRGELVALHANLRVREGASGSASHKQSIDAAPFRVHLAHIGRRLGWHGALSADAILGPTGPAYIDVNPRLVEPGNALAAGVDLVSALLEVATASSPPIRPPGRPDVRTHQLLMAVLGAAEQGRGRRGVLSELAAAARRRGSYRDSTEELTPAGGDWRAAIPLVVASLATLALPANWRWFAQGSVENYALTPSAWRKILAGA